MASTHEMPTDAILVGRVLRGDGSAFEALVRRHLRGAYAVAYALLSNEMDAEDVCQDAFMKALDRLEDCREPARFRPWLLQIVRNRAHNYRDYQRVRRGVPLDGVAPSTPEMSTRHVERGELRELLDEALTGLTDVQRQIVILHDLEEWKHREIAESLGLSEVASRQHLFNARRRLRAHLRRNTLRAYGHG